MSKFVYSVLIHQPSEKPEAPKRLAELEEMIFTNPVCVGHEIRVQLNSSYGTPGQTPAKDLDLVLGTVQQVRQYAVFGDSSASTRLILERTSADGMFAKFVAAYRKR